MIKVTRLMCLVILTLSVAFSSLPALAISAPDMPFGEPRWQIIYNSFKNAAVSSINSLSNLVTNWVGTVDSLTLIEATPTFSDDHTFTLPGNFAAVLPSGKRLVVDCGADGLKPNTVASCTYATPNSTVVVNTANLTANLAAVSYYATRNGVNTYGSGDIVASEFGSPSWANLQAAIGLGNSSGRRVLITPGTWPVEDDLASTGAVQMTPGAILQVATSKTLDLSPSFEAGLYKVFSCTGTGKVTLPAAVQKVPEWWGALGDGITDDAIPLQAWATCGGNLWVPFRTYKTTVGIIVQDNAVIDGQGTIYQSDDAVEGLVVKDDVTIKNIRLTGSAVAYGGPNYHVGIIPYSMRNGSGNNPATCALALWASGNRMKIENVKFTAWDVAVWAGLDSIVQNCKATNNWREAFYAGGTGCRVINNEIDGTDSWAIDFNGGDSLAAFNKIKNCGRVLADGGGICFAGMTTEKPMTQLSAIENSIYDYGVGYGITVISKPTDGVWGDITITGNYINGTDSASALAGVYLYVGAGSTVTCKTLKIDDNIITNSKRMIQGVYLEGGTIKGNIGRTFAPADMGAMAFGAISRLIFDHNAILDVNGAANTAMFFESTLNNCRIINHIGEGANVGLWFGTGLTGTGNDISGNDFSGCTTPIYPQAALAADNRLERNTGYVPGAALAPAVPASTIEVRNTKGYPVIVKVTAGTVTAISTGSVTGFLTPTGLTAGQVFFPAGWYISITYSSAPTWTWEGIQ